MTNNKILGMLGISAKAGKVVSGTDSCIDAMSKNKVKLLIVSEEASDKTKKNFKYYSDKYSVTMVVLGEIEELSKSIGKKNKAIIGICDTNLSKSIKQIIINGGEIIG